MKYTPKKHILTLLTLAVSLPALAQQPFGWQTDPATPNHVAPQAPGISGPAASIYTSLGTSSIWSNESRLRKFFAFLPNIEAHGLKVNDYKFTALAQMRNQDPVAFETQFSNEVLRLLSDVSVGRLNPKTVSEDVKFSKRAFKIDSRATNFFNSPSPAAFGALAPQHELYSNLVELLSRLHAVNRNGGFNGISSIPATLKLGSNSPIVYEMKSILNLSGFDLTLDNNFDAPMVAAMKKIQLANLGSNDGIISPKNRDAMEYFRVNSFDRQLEVEIMLEKIRWLPAALGEKYIFLNIATQELLLQDSNLEESSVIRIQKSINGRVDRKTPSMTDKVVQVVINPTWTIPTSIIAKDKMPKIQEAFATSGVDGVRAYLAEKGFSLFNRVTNVPMDASEIDWTVVTAIDAPFKIVQETGSDNALGVLKFTLQNPFAIYLHDTNERHLFKQFERLRSSGCVRVEHPVELATYLLDGTEWTVDRLEAEIASNGQGGKEPTFVSLPPAKRLPVYMLPMTAYKKGDQFFFTKDLYGQNKAVLKALKRAGYYNEAAQTSAPSLNGIY